MIGEIVGISFLVFMFLLAWTDGFDISLGKSNCKKKKKKKKT